MASPCDGPIRAVLFGEFDTQAGPKIVSQSPEGYVVAEVWDVVFEYVIPKPALCSHVVSVGAQGHRIVGLPTCLLDTKYSRNAYVFNVAIVLAEADSVHAVAARFEPALAAASAALCELEVSRGFLHRDDGRSAVVALLPALRDALNACSGPAGGERTLTIAAGSGSGGSEGSTSDTFALTIRVPPAPTFTSTADDEDVNVDGLLVCRQSGAPAAATAAVVAELGREAAELYEHVKGVCTVREAARSAWGTPLALSSARRCAKELLAKNLLAKADLFPLSYVATPKVRELMSNAELRDRLLQRCSRGARLEDALAVIGELKPGTTVQKLISSDILKKRKVDDPHAFLTFCLAHGWVLPMPDVQTVKEAACNVEAPNPSNLTHSALRDSRAPQRHFV
jgi:hypothetical protein